MDYTKNDYQGYKFIGFKLDTEYFSLYSNNTSGFFISLDPNIGTITENLNLLDGTLEVDALTFRIYELTGYLKSKADFTDIGYLVPYYGLNSFLGENLEPVARITRISGSTIFVDSDAQLNTEPFFYIHNFADKYDLILSSSGTRQYELSAPFPDDTYGDANNDLVFNYSRNRITQYTEQQILDDLSSKIDESTETYVDIYNKIPNLFGTRVKLSALFSRKVYDIVIATGHITIPIWQGFVSSTPKSIDGESAIEFQAESYWTKFSQRKFPLESAKTNIEGFDSRRIEIKRINADGTQVNVVGSDAHFSDTIEPDIVHKNRYEAVKKVINDNNSSGEILYLYEPVDAVQAINVGIDGNAIQFYAAYKGRRVNGLAKYFESENSGPYNPAVYKWDLFSDDCFQVVKQNGTNQQLFISPIDSYNPYVIPANSGSSSTCLSRHVWIGELDPYDTTTSTYYNNLVQNFDLEMSTDTETGLKRYGNRILYYYGGEYDFSTQLPSSNGTVKYPLVLNSGSVLVRSKELKHSDPELRAPYQPILNRAELTSKLSLASRHFIDIFRHGIVSRFDDPNVWDFSEVERIKTKMPSRATEIFVDSKNSFGDVLNNFSKLYGVVPTTAQNGKYRLKKIEQITPNTSSSFSFDETNIIGVPQYEFTGEQLVSSVVLNSEILLGGKIIINNKRIPSQYKDNGKQIEINLEDLGIERTLLNDSRYVTYLTSLISSYYFKLFSSPLMKITFNIPIVYWNDVFPGTVVTISEFSIPNSTNGRGLSNEKVLIVGRTLNFEEGIISLTALKWPSITKTGYSPCVKISSINTSSYSFTVTSSYMNTGNSEEPSDYAASNLIEVINSSSNAGTDWFNIGDRVELILRNSTTFATASFSIGSISANQIFVNQTIPTGSVNWPEQAIAGNVDLRFDVSDKSGIQTNQLKFAYIGSSSSYTDRFF